MLQTVRTPVGAFCSKEWSRIPYALHEQRFMQKWQTGVCANVPLQLSTRSRAASFITPRTNEL